MIYRRLTFGSQSLTTQHASVNMHKYQQLWRNTRRRNKGRMHLGVRRRDTRSRLVDKEFKKSHKLSKLVSPWKPRWYHFCESNFQRLKNIGRDR
mmetsp:Transcript_8769/g.18768  ORF Transcript_8769/g.18768 Transcript_8769/m.18768 type:complete len:94 (+) Transcript_8769:746-1027(+)